MSNERLVNQDLEGNIESFHKLYLEFQPQLKSFLYRLLADRNDVEDLAQDTFVKAFEKIGTFKSTSSLKTWVFQIATNLARDFLRNRKRWPINAQDKAKELATAEPAIPEAFGRVHQYSPNGRYEIMEHIDFCFTCISKTLPLDQQVVLILKDVYDFPRKEIALVIDKTEGVVKHLLFNARKTMTHIFDRRCALVNKEGTCHQCTELSGYFNPKHNRRCALVNKEEHAMH
jgi:RNA polymerase sigma-70 factor (ECF subfamily)